MSATQFGLSLLYIAVAVICYAAGWWQGKTIERDRWEERTAAQDRLVQQDKQRREAQRTKALGPSSAAQVAWGVQISEYRRGPEALPRAIDGDKRLPHDLWNREYAQ